MNSLPGDVPSSEVHGGSSEKDRAFWGDMDGILADFPHSPFHLLTQWPVYARRVNVMRFLAHFKLFEQVIDLPGDIVELGVSRGVSFFSWHKFLEIFNPTDTSRKVIGFDSFEGLSDFSEHDGREDPAVGKRKGGWSAADVKGEVYRLKDLHNRDNILAKERLILVDGRVQDTLPRFLEARAGMRISLLHFDLDLYEPTRFALDHLWDLVVPGGVVVFDEYALPPWGGETKALESFLKDRGIHGLHLKKFPWSLTPNGYLIKPA